MRTNLNENEYKMFGSMLKFQCMYVTMEKRERSDAYDERSSRSNRMCLRFCYKGNADELG
ncbi:MAG: hypothetical protein K0R67_1584 [Paenibacillus sp.]|nr:hypothetical protein [Paenibacillus sp.]